MGFSLQWLLLLPLALGRVGFSCSANGLSCPWNLPRPGIKPVSPALAGGFLTSGPLGKSCLFIFDVGCYVVFCFPSSFVICWFLIPLLSFLCFLAILPIRLYLFTVFFLELFSSFWPFSFLFGTSISKGRKSNILKSHVLIIQLQQLSTC